MAEINAKTGLMSTYWHFSRGGIFIFGGGGENMVF